MNGTDAIDWKKLHTLENGNILQWQERYVRKLVKEAGSFDNVFFEIQNEPWSDRGRLVSVVNPYLRPPARDRYPNSIDAADALSTAWQARVAEWIASEEANASRKHLIAQNYSNFGFAVERIAPGVSLVNFHYSFTAGHEDGTDTAPDGPGGGSPTLRSQLGILARFLSSMPLVRVAPDSRTVKHAAGGEKTVTTPAFSHGIALRLNRR